MPGRLTACSWVLTMVGLVSCGGTSFAPPITLRVSLDSGVSASLVSSVRVELRFAGSILPNSSKSAAVGGVSVTVLSGDPDQDGRSEYRLSFPGSVFASINPFDIPVSATGAILQPFVVSGVGLDGSNRVVASTCATQDNGGNTPVFGGSGRIVDVVLRAASAEGACEAPGVSADAGILDAGTPDAGTPDGGSPDAGTADAGPDLPPSQPTVEIRSYQTDLATGLTSADTLVAVLTAPSVDPNGTPVTYAYAWYRNSVLQNGLAADRVAPDKTAANDQWKVIVTPSSAGVNGTAGESSTVSLANAAPTVGGVLVYPLDPYAGDTLECLAHTVSDADGESLTPSWQWYTGQPESKVPVSMSDGGNLAELPTTNQTIFPPGTYVFCEISYSDGSQTTTRRSAPRSLKSRASVSWTQAYPTYLPAAINRAPLDPQYDPLNGRYLFWERGLFPNTSIPKTYGIALAWEYTGSHGWRRLIIGKDPSLLVDDLYEGQHVWEPLAGRMLLFGGGTLGDGPGTSQALLALDVTHGNEQWMSVPTNEPPPGRTGGSFIWDPVGRRAILFGGSSTPVSGTSTATPLSDAWALQYDPEGTTTWTPITPSGGPPPARYAHHAVYDAVNRRMVILGGRTSNSDADALNDVWALSLEPGREDWTQITAPSGPPTTVGSAVCARPGGGIRVLGCDPNREGCPDSDPPVFELSKASGSDQWSSTSSVDRTNVTGYACEPNGITYRLWAPIEAFPEVRRLDDGLTIAPLWTTANVPPARWKHGAIFSASESALYVFFGFGSLPRSGFGDVWRFDPKSRKWSMVSQSGTGGTPPARYDFAYAAAHGAGAFPKTDFPLHIHGGLCEMSPSIFVHCGDVWSAMGGGGLSWTSPTVTGTPPAVRRGHMMAHLPSDGMSSNGLERFRLVGGLDDTNTGSILYYGDVFDANDLWTQPGSVGMNWYDGTLVYDEISGVKRYFLFGGVAGADPPTLTNALAYTPASSNSWMTLSPDFPPAARRKHTATAIGPGQIIVMGGTTDGASALSDILRLSCDQAAPPNCAWPTISIGPPLNAFGHTASYDSTSGTLYVFGGHTGSVVKRDLHIYRIFP